MCLASLGSEKVTQLYPEVISKTCSIEEALVREQVQGSPASSGINPLGARLWDGVKDPEREVECVLEIQSGAIYQPF